MLIFIGYLMWRKSYGDVRFCGGDAMVEIGGATGDDGGD